MMKNRIEPPPGGCLDSAVHVAQQPNDKSYLAGKERQEIQNELRQMQGLYDEIKGKGKTQSGSSIC